MVRTVDAAAIDWVRVWAFAGLTARADGAAAPEREEPPTIVADLDSRWVPTSVVDREASADREVARGVALAAAARELDGVTERVPATEAGRGVVLAAGGFRDLFKPTRRSLLHQSALCVNVNSTVWLESVRPPRTLRTCACVKTTTAILLDL